MKVPVVFHSAGVGRGEVVWGLGVGSLVHWFKGGGGIVERRQQGGGNSMRLNTGLKLA